MIYHGICTKKEAEFSASFFIHSDYSAVVKRSLLLKRIEMHQSAQRPTKVKITLAIMCALPGKIQDTKSKLKSPMLPQFKPPMIRRERASLSSILNTSDRLWFGFRDIKKRSYIPKIVWISFLSSIDVKFC
jgi:hypothetical protein